MILSQTPTAGLTVEPVFVGYFATVEAAVAARAAALAELITSGVA